MKFESKVLPVILGELLRPIVRFCLRSGLTYRNVVEDLKKIFVEEGQAELERSKDQVSASRLAVLTGLHRGDITLRLNNEIESESQPDILKKIIGLWRGGKKYTLPSDEPRPLTFRGPDSEFMKLVNEVSREISPYTILRELERAGLVDYIGNRLVLQASLYIPKKNVQRSYKLLANDIDLLIRSVEENVFVKSKVQNLHLTTQFDNIPIDSLPEIKSWLMNEGIAFHERSRKFLGEYDLDLNPKSRKNGGAKVSIGTFSLSESPKITIRKEIRRRGRPKKSD